MPCGNAVDRPTVQTCYAASTTKARHFLEWVGRGESGSVVLFVFFYYLSSIAVRRLSSPILD